MPDSPPGGRPLRLVAAPFTALHLDGSLRLDAIPEQLCRLRADGVSGAFVCGTTGEAASLTVDERMQVVERWCESSTFGFEVIVHVGHTSVTDARSMAQHAAGVGASGIASVAPYYHRPERIEDLVRFCELVAEAAPDLPFFYYHIPRATGVGLSMVEFVPAARERIPSFAGVKFAHNDLEEFARCVEAAGTDVKIYFGRDELLLPGLVLGANSAVGSTYNFAAPLYHEMARALGNGNFAYARQAQSAARSMIDVATSFGGHPALKAIYGSIGVGCGPCRPPFPTLDEQDTARLGDELKRIGFIDALNTARTRWAPQ